MSGELRMTGVTMEFPGRLGARKVLDGIDLTVAPGEFVCLVGASGSGKSTLLSLAAGLRKPTEGTITLDGEQVQGPGPERGLVLLDEPPYGRGRRPPGREGPAVPDDRAEPRCAARRHVGRRQSGPVRPGEGQGRERGAGHELRLRGLQEVQLTLRR